jgi:hypothetical protein
MSNRRFITFKGEDSNEEVDLELPADVTIEKLLPDLIKVLYWPNPSTDDPANYRLWLEQGDLLDKKKSLGDLGIQNSDLIWIGFEDSSGRDTTANIQGYQDSEQVPVDPSPQDRRGYLTPKSFAEIPITAPSLVSDMGYIFIIGKPPVLIGRKAMGVEPDIDLSEIDVEIVSSKKHAEIDKKKEDYIIKPLETTNGTFVNGVEVLPGEERKLEDQDVIQFGFSKGVKLEFRLPN